MADIPDAMDALKNPKFQLLRIGGTIYRMPSASLIPVSSNAIDAICSVNYTSSYETNLEAAVATAERNESDINEAEQDDDHMETYLNPIGDAVSDKDRERLMHCNATNNTGTNTVAAKTTAAKSTATKIIAAINTSTAENLGNEKVVKKKVKEMSKQLPSIVNYNLPTDKRAIGQLHNVGARTVLQDTPGTTPETATAVLYGKNKSNFNNAKMEMQKPKRETQSREQMNFTHFICFPIKDSACIDAFETFKRTVLNSNYVGISEKLFMKSHSLHISLLLLTLLTDEEVDECVSLLDAFPSYLNKNFPSLHGLSVNLKAVYCMGNAANAANVLYTTHSKSAPSTGTVAPDNTIAHINDIVTALVELMKSKNLVTDGSLKKQRLISFNGGTRGINVHMTLINTRYGHSSFIEGEMTSMPTAEKGKIDASYLIKAFSTFEFGTARLGTISLNKIGERSSSGQYINVKSVSIQ